MWDEIFEQYIEKNFGDQRRADRAHAIELMKNASPAEKDIISTAEYRPIEYDGDYHYQPEDPFRALEYARENACDQILMAFRIADGDEIVTGDVRPHINYAEQIGIPAKALPLFILEEEEIKISA